MVVVKNYYESHGIESVQNAPKTKTNPSHLSHKKTPYDIPLNPGCLTGILIMVYEIIPIYVGNIITYRP